MNNLVLVHGILGFNRVLGIEYFNGIAERFKTQFHVFTPQLDPTRGVAFRGTQLRDAIHDALARGMLDPQQKTHIIAHSMGGLDSRFMLSPANPNRIQLPIRSLTTISTPHRGSSIADLLDSSERSDSFPRLPFSSKIDPLQEILNRLNISLDGLRDLTTANCQAFNARFVDNPDVRYFSVAGSGRTGPLPTSALLLPLHAFVSDKTGEPNDGLVTTASAQCGQFDPDTWPGDHAEEIGHNLDNPAVLPAFYLAKFDQIVARIQEL